MKHSSSYHGRWHSGANILVAFVGFSAGLINTALANLTMDMRVGGIIGEGTILDGKTITGVEIGSIITLEIWAQITPLGRPVVNNILGVQSVRGSILTSTPPEGASVRGNMSQAVPQAPFNAAGSAGGTLADLSEPPDGSLDLGSNAVNSISGQLFFRSSTADGEANPGNSLYFISNNVPSGATVNTIYNGGYEFLMGTVAFTVSDVLDFGDPALSLNWRFSTFPTPILKGQRAIWTQGDGTNDTGYLQEDLLSVGAPVMVSAAAVPEPGTATLLFSCLASLLTFRRARHAELTTP